MSFYTLVNKLKEDESKKDFIEYLYANHQDISNMIYQKQKEINELIEVEKKLREDIISLCKHQWIIDRTNIGEKTEWVCSICGKDK